MNSFLIVVLFVAICYGQLTTEQKNPLCIVRNTYVPMEGSCDAYIECVNFQAKHMQCPDGLRYNPQAVWPAYPCGYPMEVSCEGRGTLQKAISTAECPHQYGFFPTSDVGTSDCGKYKMCVEGQAIEMLCPPGLAFNPDTARCDWPEQVSTCNIEAFIGFKCPEIPMDKDGKPLDVVLNYKYEGNCVAFYSCERGRVRLLTCDIGLAFNPVSGHCEDIDKVACVGPAAVPAAISAKFNSRHYEFN